MTAQTPGDFDRDDFIEALEREFPEVAADIDPEVEGGLLHLEVATLCRHAQTAIDSSDFDNLRRHFRFADEFFRRAKPDLKNAFYVSYLEHLNFQGHRASAKSLLPPALSAGWREISDYLEQLSTGDRAKMKPPR